MSAVPIELCGHRLLLDPLGGVWWPDAGVLTVADLHLEKGSAAARQGRLVPPWDTIITLDRLARMIRRWQPRTVVTLGDSFHDVHGPARMEPETFARLRTLTEAARFVWVLGNHDPVAPDHLPGDACTEWLHQGLVFRHEARLHAEGELCGHHHPKAGVDTRAGRNRPPLLRGQRHPPDAAGDGRLHRWPGRAAPPDHPAVPPAAPGCC